MVILYEHFSYTLYTLLTAIAIIVPDDVVVECRERNNYDDKSKEDDERHAYKIIHQQVSDNEGG